MYLPTADCERRVGPCDGNGRLVVPRTDTCSAKYNYTCYLTNLLYSETFIYKYAR